MSIFSVDSDFCWIIRNIFVEIVEIVVQPVGTKASGQLQPHTILTT